MSGMAERSRDRSGAGASAAFRAGRCRLAAGLLLALLLLGGAEAARAQTAGFAPLRADGGGVSALARRVDVVLDDVTVAQAVRTIAQSAGVGFTWAEGLPDLDLHVTVHARSSTAAAALLRAVEGTRLSVMVAPSGQLVLVRRPPPPPPARASIRGFVRERGHGAPIGGARVRLVGAGAGAVTVEDGSFWLPTVKPGSYALEVTGLGLEPVLLPAVRAALGDSAPPLQIEVALAPVALAAVVVAPGHFGVMETTPAAQATVTREEVETRPQLGEDLFRAINRLPGIASSDMAAPFHVRGGAADELYVTLDGMELYEPFHLKDMDAALSILDVESVGRVDLTTGGFTAEVGNRLTGVLDIRSVEPRTDRRRTALGISVTNVRAQSQGGFAGGRGGWLFSARRGYLDLAFKMTNLADSLSPRYYDVFGKVRYDLPGGHRLSLEALHAGDGLRYRDNGGYLSSGYGNTYIWGTWQASLPSGLELRTMVSTGRLTWERHGEGIDLDHLLAGADDRRGYDFVGLKHDGSAQLAPALLLRWGAEARGLSASYDYTSVAVRTQGVAGALHSTQDSVGVDMEQAGSQLGAYAAARLRLASWAVAEAGGRADRQSYTGEHQLSPRLNLVLNPGRGTTIRTAWGRYFQPQGTAGIQVQDGMRVFGPAERATQVVAGVEQRLGDRTSLRAEVYRRELGPERPRWISLDLDLNLFPEVEPGRMLIEPRRGRAQGAELLLRWRGERFDWAGSYALATVEDEIGGRMVPRLFDQRHTAYVDGAVHGASGRWRLSWAWQVHSGWPDAPLTAAVDTLRDSGGNITNYLVRRLFALPGGARLPWYHRVDLRATRSFDLRSGRVSLYADLFNALNQLNPRSYELWVNISSSGVQTSRRYRPQVPRMASAGVSWEF